MLTWRQLKSMCVVLMCLDPVPESAKWESNDMEAFLDEESKRYGFQTWIEAYHAMEPAKEPEQTRAKKLECALCCCAMQRYVSPAPTKEQLDETLEAVSLHQKEGCGNCRAGGNKWNAGPETQGRWTRHKEDNMEDKYTKYLDKLRQAAEKGLGHQDSRPPASSAEACVDDLLLDRAVRGKVPEVQSHSPGPERKDAVTPPPGRTLQDLLSVLRDPRGWTDRAAGSREVVLIEALVRVNRRRG